LIVIGIFYWLESQKSNPTSLVSESNSNPTSIPENQSDSNPAENEIQNSESTSIPENENQEKQDSSTLTEPRQIIGKSAGGYDIFAYHYGSGNKEILLIGGIHGGYSWNTALLAYQMMDYFDGNPQAIPAGIKLTIIPVLNPDGLSRVVDSVGRFKPTDVSSSQEARKAGRFNANNVDLNRNFDCNWQPTAVWQDKTVSGGTKVFSEPEAQAIRDYAQNPALTAVIAWYSSAGGVFSSSCNGEIPAATQAITEIYAQASGYPAHKDFDYYEISGDMTNWFAKNNIPAIGVVLTNSDDVEWDKNLAGVKAVLQYLSNNGQK